MPPRAPYQALHPAERLLCVREVAGLLRIGVRTVWRYVALGKLAEPIRLSPQKVLWRATDIEEFLNELRS